MRKTSFIFGSILPFGIRVAGLFCLATLLLVPAWARSKRYKTRRPSKVHQTHPQVRHPHRTAQAPHSTSHVQGRVAPGKRAVSKPHSKTRENSPYIHHARYQHRGHRRGRRYRLEAALDDVSTHASATEVTAGAEETVSPDSSSEAVRPLSLTDAVASPAGEEALTASVPLGGAEGRDLPVFSSPVPRYMPVALRGSHEVLVHQNVIADVEGLRRIQNDSQLSVMVRTGDLVALPASGSLAVDSRLPLNRRYCRPWTAKFLSDLSHAHEEVFGRPLQLTSAVRTIAFQRHLAHYNGNAAPAYGDTASPHLTGQAIDLGKKGMSQHEIAWMRTVLGQLQSRGKLDVEEEFEQACFHISVYKTYAPQSKLPESLIASNDEEAGDAAPVADVADSAIGGVARPVVEPVVRIVHRRHARGHAGHSTRRAVIVHRRRHHRHTMSLLAARMR